jgi:hypothetical protein
LVASGVVRACAVKGSVTRGSTHRVEAEPARTAYRRTAWWPEEAAADPPRIDVFDDAFRTDVNLCNGEDVPLVGTFRVVTHEHPGEQLIQVFTYHAKGVGSQDNEYVLNINGLQESDADLDRVQREVLVSLGSAPNQILLITLPGSGGIIVEADCTG